jgi:hypothetical protein
MADKKPFSFDDLKGSLIRFFPDVHAEMFAKVVDLSNVEPVDILFGLEKSECPTCADLVMVKKRVNQNALKLDAKQHKKRRNQSESYHRRVQKKWDRIASKKNKWLPTILQLDEKVLERINRVVNVSGTRTGRVSGKISHKANAPKARADSN